MASKGGKTPHEYVGKILDERYQLAEVIGQGGMGLVFRGIQTSVQRPVAIKTLHPEMAMAPQFFERFKREAEIASRLHHPNIVTVFDFGKTKENLCYYVMELIAGESLRQRVKRLGPLSLREAAAIIEQCAAGIGHAHKQNVVHRDIKPHNIMIAEVDGHQYVKVLDFGLVKALENDDDHALTSTGQVLGTPQYMPPEQAGGEDVDQRSDLYSLAAVFYFCLTGTSPFNANSVRKALTAALTQQVPPVSTHRKGAPVPRTLDEFFRKGLALEKIDRYQTCAELMEDLFAALRGLPDAQLDALPDADDAPSSSRSARKSNATPSKVFGPTAVGRPLPSSPSEGFARRVTAPERSLPKARTALPLLAVAALFLLLVVAGGYLAFTPAQPPLKPAVVPMLNVTLRSTPGGANVFEDGILVGKTPLQRTWRRGESHTVRLELENFVSLERSFRLESNEAFALTLEPKRVVTPTPPRKHRQDSEISPFE